MWSYYPYVLCRRHCQYHKNILHFVRVVFPVENWYKTQENSQRIEYEKSMTRVIITQYRLFSYVADIGIFLGVTQTDVRKRISSKVMCIKTIFPILYFLKLR